MIVRRSRCRCWLTCDVLCVLSVFVLLRPPRRPLPLLAAKPHSSRGEQQQRQECTSSIAPRKNKKQNSRPSPLLRSAAAMA